MQRLVVRRVWHGMELVVKNQYVLPAFPDAIIIGIGNIMARGLKLMTDNLLILHIPQRMTHITSLT